MASSTERLSHAREIVARRDISLAYMIDDPLSPDDDGPIGRYMLVTQTDGFEDCWLEFIDSVDEALQKVEHLLVDEWGYAGLYDLDSNSYLDPLRLRVQISIGRRPTASTTRHSMVA